MRTLPGAARTLLPGSVALALALAPPLLERAWAGEYHVYSCRTPSGETAPADGWSPAKSGAYTYADDTCGAPGGALVAALGPRPGRTANTDVASWAFAAPVGETIAGATLWRAGDADGGAAINATYQFWLAGSREPEVFDECLSALGCPAKGSQAQPLSVENRVAVPAANLGEHLFMNASCGGVNEYTCPEGKTDPENHAAAVHLYAADITLAQATGPTVANVSGELASAPSVRGMSAVLFSASDPGSGVYGAAFNVDGQLVQQTVIDEGGGRCRKVGQSADGRPAFLYVQPCPSSVGADVGLDTTTLSDGPHHVVVSVLDAAGNSAPVLDREITVANAATPCARTPAPAASTGERLTLNAIWKGTRRQAITTAYGRTRTIEGRLTGPGGAPVAGAVVGASATSVLAGARPVALANPRTAPDGRFSVRVPGGASSRVLCLAYGGFASGGSPIATRTLKLSVRAGIVLRISPRTASVGRSISFSGRLRGGQIPRGGKQLVLEARSGGSGWLEFKVIRTNARGRFHASYRFKFPGPAVYRFRVLSEAEADYPFAAGSSRAVGVFER